MSHADPDGRVHLIYDEAIRGLDIQATDLREFRTRASSLLAGASIAAGFLGSETFMDHRGFTVWNFLGTAAFVFTGTIAAFVLAPRGPRRRLTDGTRPGWVFYFGAQRLFDTYLDDPARTFDLVAMQSELALHAERNHDHNEGAMRGLASWLQVATVLVVAEIVFLLIDLATR